MNKEISLIRRINLKKVLKRGQIKLLAEKLGTDPNYLSQLFSLRSDREISDVMARNIETVLNLDTSDLDIIDVKSFEEGQVALANVNLSPDDRKKQYKMAEELVMFRLKQYYPDITMMLDVRFTLNENVFIADMMLRSTNGDIKLLVELKAVGEHAMFERKAVTNGLGQLSALMNITGCQHGLLAISKGHEITENWLSMASGKLELSSKKPVLD